MKTKVETMERNSGPERRGNVILRLRQLELFGICAMVFFLPAMESPKSLAFVIFVLGTILRRVAEGCVGLRRPTSFEWGLLSLWCICVFSTAVNWPLETGIDGLKNSSMYLLVGWLTYINRYRGKSQQWILWALISGLMVALAWSWVDLMRGANEYLEFHSIPNLNRSVIYHVVAMFVMLAVIMDHSSDIPMALKIYAVAALLVSIPSLFVMGSRGGLLGFIAGLFLIFMLIPKNRKVVYTLAAGLTVCVVAFTVLLQHADQPVIAARINKFAYYYKTIRDGKGLRAMVINSDMVRYEYLRVAWAQINQGGKYFIGTGPASYGSIDMGKLTFDPPLEMIIKEGNKPSHPHNSYLNKWVEEGLIGLCVYLGFMIFILWALVLNRPPKDRVNWPWIAGLGTISTIFVSGLFNNVLTNEMGWLVMVVLGSYMSFREFSNPVPLSR